MPTVTVKNIPPELYERLKQLAEANRRSINSEIIACIEQSVSSKRLDLETLLVNARQLREKTSHYRMSDEELNRAKEAGRL
jgi:predicted transcriptional regulator